VLRETAFSFVASLLFLWVKVSWLGASLAPPPTMTPILVGGFSAANLFSAGMNRMKTIIHLLPFQSLQAGTDKNRLS
jgi:hypothetical protein